MKNLLNFFIIILLFAASCEESWNYKDQDKWSKAYPQCAGKYQSPVDIQGAVTDSNLSPLFIDYYASDSIHIKNTGTTVKLSHLSGSVITPDTSYYGHQYYLANIHFHTPSEHTVGGKHFPVEIHFVNIDTSYNLMVLAVFIKEGQKNPALEQILASLPRKHKETILKSNFDPTQLLPNNASYWHYTGSLTTPPCTENVQWFVMKQPVEASKEQIEKLHQVLGDNNRSVKPLNGRIIKEFGF